MHHILAAILIQLNQPHPGKQEILCFEYALASKLEPFGVCHRVDEALAMVMAGTVTAVITAIDPGGSLAEDLARFGGQLHIVRQHLRTPAVESLENRVLRSGLDTGQIATLLQVSPEEVRRRRRNSRE